MLGHLQIQDWDLSEHARARTHTHTQRHVHKQTINYIHRLMFLDAWFPGLLRYTRNQPCALHCIRSWRAPVHGFRVQPTALSSGVNIRALVARIGFWGPLYYNYSKEPPKIVILEAPTLGAAGQLETHGTNTRHTERLRQITIFSSIEPRLHPLANIRLSLARM